MESKFHPKHTKKMGSYISYQTLVNAASRKRLDSVNIDKASSIYPFHHLEIVGTDSLQHPKCQGQAPILLFGKEHLAEIVAAKQLLHRCVAVG